MVITASRSLKCPNISGATRSHGFSTFQKSTAEQGPGVFEVFDCFPESLSSWMDSVVPKNTAKTQKRLVCYCLIIYP